ncbi:MAG TPA: hypothetical protein VMU65_04665 [Candidatus Saccharimonadales bacterium]|nr:hypothetical protein [Candidatus Saccharimonadales bacterium]
MQRESHGLPSAQPELRCHRGAVDRDLNRRRETEPGRASLSGDAALDAKEDGKDEPILRTRAVFHLHLDLPLHSNGAAQQQMGRAATQGVPAIVGTNRERVDELHGARCGVERRLQHHGAI